MLGASLNKTFPSFLPVAFLWVLGVFKIIIINFQPIQITYMFTKWVITLYIYSMYIYIFVFCFVFFVLFFLYIIVSDIFKHRLRFISGNPVIY